MDQHSLAVLDFPAVLARLSGLCTTPLGQRQALSLQPAIQRREVARRLAETDEARVLVDAGFLPPVGGVADVGALLGRAARGGILDGDELQAVAAGAAACRRTRRFFAAHPEAPLLGDWAERLSEFGRLEGEVQRCLDDDGAVTDAASDRLAALRRQQRQLQARVRERLEAMLRSAAVQPYLQEPLITLRGDRFVLPVRVEQRQQVPGVVHDQSASGATVFVEPLAVVEANNELRRMVAEERAEIQRVLAALSAEVGRSCDELAASLDILAHLDVAAAKARLSQALDGRSPEIAASPGIELVRARHPLIERPVPLDLRLGAACGYSALVVSGPNTGGKTVALKTAGLLACMAQAGLHLPVADGSRLGPFPQIYCDAGDEQGVTQNLSTFSSHLSRIVRFLGDLPPGSLLLLDELGAGTDPSEGAALAAGVIEEVLEQGGLVAATTHYGELIAFAYDNAQARNASVEFDAETLRPTYRLVTGLPGRSNALAIAARLGLGPSVIGRAQARLRPGERHVARLIAGLEEEERRVAEELAAAEAGRRDAEVLRRTADERLASTEARAAERLANARAEAAEILRAARQQAEEAARELRRQTARADRDALAAVEALRADLRARAEALGAGAIAPAQPAAAPPPGGWRAGQAVVVRSLGLRGVLLAEPDGGGQAPVQAGALRVTVRSDDLAPDGAAPDPVRDAPSRVPAAGLPPGGLAAAAAFSPECDLRGMSVAEAVEHVDRYLDAATLAACGRVRLIHGKGTGALRQAVAEFLRGHPQVSAFRVGPGATDVDVRV